MKKTFVLTWPGCNPPQTATQTGEVESLFREGMGYTTDDREEIDALEVGQTATFAGPMDRHTVTRTA